MNRNFERALKLVLGHEGGWSDHPADPGSATMKGITMAALRTHVNPGATKDDLRSITDAQVAKIYRRHYWDVVRGAELPDGVDYAVFDFAVNSGPSRAARHLQAVVGVPQDGRIGPATLTAVAARPSASIIDALCSRRLAFLMSLRNWPVFSKGWSFRVRSVRLDALDMATQLPILPPKRIETRTPPPGVANGKPPFAEPPQPGFWTRLLAAAAAILAAWRARLGMGRADV